MNEDTIDIVFICFLIAAAMVVGYAIGNIFPRAETKHLITCEYEGGELHDHLCIKDGVVIKIGDKR